MFRESAKFASVANGCPSGSDPEAAGLPVVLNGCQYSYPAACVFILMGRFVEFCFEVDAPGFTEVPFAGAFADAQQFGDLPMVESFVHVEVEYRSRCAW